MDQKKKIIDRLKRLNGQITALQNMMENGEDCEKVFIQFKAAKSALENAFFEALKMSLTECTQKKDPKTMEHIVGLLTKM